MLTTFAQPGGIVTDEAYDFIKSAILERIARTAPFDGALLDLHGAMVTESHEDAEATCSKPSASSSERRPPSSSPSTFTATSPTR